MLYYKLCNINSVIYYVTEEFIYSYARSLTRLIPEDYHADERYINGGVNVQYVDKDSLPDSKRVFYSIH